MAYKELLPSQPAIDGSNVQPPLSEEAFVEALAGLATVHTSVQNAIEQKSLPEELGTTLRYANFLSLLFFRSFTRSFFTFSVYIAS
jgi:hypothetical protein